MSERWFVASMVALVACRPPPPAEPLEKPVARPHPEWIAEAKAARAERDDGRIHEQYIKRDTARPDVEEKPWATSPRVPNPTERLLRWPLSPSDHPELAPRYPVAQKLAEPGVDWMALCKMGAQNRTSPAQAEQIRYLRGWCHSLERNVNGAFDELNPLLTSRDHQLATSVEVDLANMLVDQGNADRARRLLVEKKIDDLVIYDRLAAMYIDLGQRDDALDINSLASSSSRSMGSDACMRQGRRIALVGDTARGRFVSSRHYLTADLSTPACKMLEAELQCWYGRDCGDYFVRAKQPAIANLYRVIATWSNKDTNSALELGIALNGLTTEDEIREGVEVVDTLEHNFACVGTTAMQQALSQMSLRKNFPKDLTSRWTLLYDYPSYYCKR